MCIFLPNIAGHVGSDITAGIIAAKLAEQDGMRLFVDIGTNGEIVLAKNGRLLTCDQSNIVSAGNTAGVGASMALLSLKEREEADRQAERTEHIELAALTEFQEEYIKATRF